MYLVPGLIDLCNEKLSDFLIKIRNRNPYFYFLFFYLLGVFYAY